jgi:hypothetical protein
MRSPPATSQQRTVSVITAFVSGHLVDPVTLYQVGGDAGRARSKQPASSCAVARTIISEELQK